MERKNLPIITMLTAGALVWIITFFRNDPPLKKLIILFVVLVFFYAMGTVIKWAFDEFDKRNAEKKAAEEEVEVEEEVEEEEE